MSPLASPTTRVATVSVEVGLLLQLTLDGIHFFQEHKNDTIRLFNSKAGKFYQHLFHQK